MLQLADLLEAVDLPPDRLRELTTTGDAAERLWSAWALALREGRRATADLRHAIAAEPNSGTRSMVATVLAGFGDAATLRLLAKHDPAPLVRETACQALTRIAGDDAASVDFLRQRLTDDAAPEVRAAVALILPTDLSVLRASAEGDTSPFVRRAACHAIARKSACDLATIDFLLFRMAHDPAPEVRAAVALDLPAWAPAAAFARCAVLLRDPHRSVRTAAIRRLVGHARALEGMTDDVAEGNLAALAAVPPELCGRILDRCIALRVEAPWDHLEPLAALGFADTRVLALLAVTDVRPALGWLLRRVLRKPEEESRAKVLLCAALAEEDGFGLSTTETDWALSLHTAVWSEPRRSRPAEGSLLHELTRVLATRTGNRHDP